jgi:methyl-accepting chemotaxis protein
VVAEEIRKLADTSARTPRKIGRQLKEVIDVIKGRGREREDRDAFSEIRSEIDGTINASRRSPAPPRSWPKAGSRSLRP